MRYFNRTILFSHRNGDRTDYIPPLGGFSFDFNVEKQNRKVSHSIRMVGEADYFWKWRCEEGSPFGISMVLDDALCRDETFNETYSLKLECKNEPYERNAWIKLHQNDLMPGHPCTFSFAGKAETLSFDGIGGVFAELEIYKKRTGRHPDDVFDPPDEVKQIQLQNGSYDWREEKICFTMPEDAVCVIVHIGIKNASGIVWLSSPRLFPENGENIIPPYDRQQKRHPEFCYAAENISRRDWIEFECEIDGKNVFSGEKYSSIVRRPDYEIELGELEPGRHTFSLKLKNDYDSSVGFIVQQLELLEYGNHSFELIAAPEHVRENASFPVLVRTMKPDIVLEAGGVKQKFSSPGLHALTLPPLSEKIQTTVVKSDDFSDSFTITGVPADGDEILLSTGDSIFIQQTIPDMERFLEWYFRNNIGNSICFRHSYRWGGGRYMNNLMWESVLALLREMGMRYFLMVDGRELPGRNANPPESLMNGNGYRGRQAHENDGAFYYWGNKLWKDEPLPEPLADILSRGVDKGGIQPHVRPKREGDRAWWFFHPSDAENMKEAAESFVRNIADAKGESTRHSGPSTLFRYFFQAGYQFLLAEQMYGPEEVILSSLRGASKAYGADGFGAHLAAQWSSTPHDTPEHAERYYLSLATCYMHGATEINMEEGLYRMEKGFADYDRFSPNCLRHLDAHTKFRRFMETNPRKGKMVVPVACVQGRFDAWSCFSRGNAWKREGSQWKFGEAEESFDLLNLFYPRSRFSAIYRCPCPVAPQGWYTGTPYGPVDLIPFEGEWKEYKAIIFLGWHSFYEEDGEKMLAYVREGGTLLLSKRHLSMTLEHDKESTFRKNSALSELLGAEWLKEKSGIVKRNVGKGLVICFMDDLYPANSRIRDEYMNAMRETAEKICLDESKKCWVKGNEDVSFSVYEDKHGNRDVYLLNIRWWDGKNSEIRLCRDGKDEPVIVKEGCITVANGCP